MKLLLLIVLILPLSSFAQSLSEKQDEVTAKSSFSPYALYYKRTFKQTGEIPANTFLAPQSLDVDVFAFGTEYNITDQQALRLTGSYVENHIILKGFRTIDAKTKGLSDTRLDYLYSINNNISLGLGVSLPTGSIDQKQNGHLISYPGQLGSGTYDFVPQIEAKYSWGDFSLRPRLWATIRSGRNDQDYRLGNEFRAIINGRYNINKYLAVTTNLHYKDWWAVVGSQPRPSRSHSQGSGGRPPAGIQQMLNSSPHSAQQSVGQGHQQRPGYAMTQRPTTDHPQSKPKAGGPPANIPTNSSPGSMSDPFAAAGTRWGANMGLATGVYLGGGFIFAIEAGTPVYYEQNSELEGLEVDWYATGFITKRF